MVQAKQMVVEIYRFIEYNKKRNLLTFMTQ